MRSKFREFLFDHPNIHAAVQRVIDLGCVLYMVMVAIEVTLEGMLKWLNTFLKSLVKR